MEEWIGNNNDEGCLWTEQNATCLGPGDMHFSCLHACIIYVTNLMSLVVCLSF